MRLTKKQSKQRKLKQERDQQRLEKLIRDREPVNRKAKSSARIPDYNFDDPTKDIPSVVTAGSDRRATEKKVYAPEMEAREIAAQAEKDRKRRRLAVAYNKGPVMYITDGTDPKDLGRKT